MTEIASGATFPGQVRAATTLLESIAADRGRLATIPQADGQRLLAACARVYHPDAKSRRLLVKATIRERKAALLPAGRTPFRYRSA